MGVVSPALDLTRVRERTSCSAAQSNSAGLDAAGRAAAVARNSVPVVALLVTLIRPNHAITAECFFAADAGAWSVLIVFTLFAGFDLLVPASRRLACTGSAKPDARLALRSADQINAAREQLITPAHGISDGGIGALSDNLRALPGARITQLSRSAGWSCNPFRAVARKPLSGCVPIAHSLPGDLTGAGQSRFRRAGFTASAGLNASARFTASAAFGA
jgi:hypothetical protein